MAGPHAGNRNRPAYSGQPRFRYPKQVIKLFAPRKPVEFKPPPRKRRLRSMTGLSSFVSKFEEKRKLKDEDMSTKETSTFETPAQRRRRVREERIGNVERTVAERRGEWNPLAEGRGTQKSNDKFKTLFVGNVNYKTMEVRLRDEFEAFGMVKAVIMPKDAEGVPRGYAFVEFERERDAKAAFNGANGMRVDGRRLLIDFERGRTVPDWLPNRLDGPFNSCAQKSGKGDERREHGQREERNSPRGIS